MTQVFKFVVAMSVAISACRPSGPGPGPSSRLADDPSVGGPDLTISIEGQPEVQGGRIHFVLRLANTGMSMPAATDVAAKAFLIKKEDYATKLAGKGVVLDPIVVRLQLANSESNLIAVEQALPALEAGTYLLGATVNTGVSLYVTEDDLGGGDPDDEDRPAPPGDPVHESYRAQLNNVTEHLAVLGELDTVTAAPRTGKYDLYHEVENAAVHLQSGTASHSSRNILRVMEGNAVLPPESDWDTEISARFLFIDLANARASLGAYTSRSLDKVWTAISFNDERDLQGRDIYVDYYSNAPFISHLAPGEYLLGVLMNVSHAFKLDSYPENNLDLTYMNLSQQSIMKLPLEVWIPAANPSKTVRASIADRADLHQWRFSADSKPEWVTVTPLAPNEYSYSLQITAEPLHAPLGMTDFPITVTAERQGAAIQSTTLVRFYKNSGPVLELIGVPDETANLARVGGRVDEMGGTKTLRLGITVRSAGADRLVYSATSSSTQIETNANGDLAPGESSVIGLKVPLVGFSIPANGKPIFSVSLKVESNAGSYPVYFDICFDPANPLAADTDCSDSGDDDDDDDDE